MKKYLFPLASLLGITAILIAIEYSSGRSVLWPDGKFGWWDGNIWGSENSQRVADIYSLSHVIHGVLFFWFLTFAKKIPMKWRFFIALLLEAGWEILENAPIIINRYRESTIAQGYFGDSILNSASDIVMMAIGFVFAYFARVWQSILLVVFFELLALYLVRDNLILNVWMLLAPSETIKEWQAQGENI